MFGDVFRLNKDWSFGTLRTGALVETSDTDRHNILFDLTTGAPDNRYTAVPFLGSQNQNSKLQELSSWFQYQLFVDFVWRPLPNLTVTPGFKYVNFRRTCRVSKTACSGPTARGLLAGTNTYDKPLYFATANYKILPEWSVYAQYATGFLIPALSALYADQVTLNNLQPSETINYQGGTVYSHGSFTADADVYLIKVSNLFIPSPNGQYYINAGNAQYTGVEGEAAYAFPFGLTVFGNGSINTAKNTTAGQTQLNAPKWTDAFGALYDRGHWQASATWKQVGSQVVFYNGAKPSDDARRRDCARRRPAARDSGLFSTISASLGYDFGKFKLKVAAFNLADHRAITSITGPTATDFYTYQAGRTILGTIEAKFR